MTDSNYKSEHNLDKMSKNLPHLYCQKWICMFSRFSLSGAELTNSVGAVKGKKYGYQPYFVAELLWKSSKIKLYLCHYSSTPNMKKRMTGK